MAQVRANRAELLDALKSVSRMARTANKAEAVLCLKGDALTISLPGMEVGAAASGDLTGRVRVPVTFFLMLAKVPPSGDPILFEVSGGRLKVGSSTTACTCEAETGARIRLPLNPPFPMVLSVAYHYTPSDIEQAGLKETVADAEKRRDILIGNALVALADFGVTREELRALVDAKMKQTEKP
jgi:hypothetical protein